MGKNTGLKYIEQEGSEIYIKFKNGEEVCLDCTKENLNKNYDKGRFVLDFECYFLSESDIKTLLRAPSNEIDKLIMKKCFLEAEFNNSVLSEFTFTSGKLNYEKLIDGTKYYYRFNYVVGIEEGRPEFIFL